MSHSRPVDSAADARPSFPEPFSTFERLTGRLAADRWSLYVEEPGGFSLKSSAEHPRDRLYPALAPALLTETGWVTGAPSDLGDAGRRLEAAGAAHLLVLVAPYTGHPAFVAFENPSPERAEELASDPAPEEMTFLGRGTSATAGAGPASEATERRRALLEARSRIAESVHEDLTQVITNVALQLQVLERSLDDPDRARGLLESSREAVETALEDLRGAIFELAPRTTGTVDLPGGLARYIDEFGDRWGLEIDYAVRGSSPAVDADTVALVFSFVQEALTNVRKHAEVSEAEVSVSRSDGRLKVDVRDGGRGFIPEDPGPPGFRRHRGLEALRARAELVGGRLIVESRPGSGTSISIECPISG